MTKREEEILNKAANEQKTLMESMDWRAGFISGSKWADSNPQENLIDIEKACNWIKDRISIPYEGGTTENGDTLAKEYLDWAKKRLEVAEEICNDFRKAMKK